MQKILIINNDENRMTYTRFAFLNFYFDIIPEKCIELKARRHGNNTISLKQRSW